MTKLSRSNGSRSKSTIFIVTAALCGAASLIFSHHVIGTRSTNGTTDESALDLLADLLTVPAVEKKGVTVSLAVPVVEHQEYVPASSEKYIVEHAVELGYASEKNPAGCLIWKDPKATNAEMHKSLNSYSTDIDSHTAAIKNFKPIPDLLKSIVKTGNHDVCATARPHPDGLKALFPSNQLSLTDSGYVEPLTPPMRNNKVCDPGGFKHLMSLDYLVHDFEHMCRKLKPTSKRVLIDMGASLSFHGADQPIVTLLELYEKFGFEFDHIYGFEMKFTKPEQVFGELLPEKYLPIYHWINVGVTHEEGHRLNPLHSILSAFDEDDFIVVKLDIDTSFIEVPLAQQLLAGGKDGIYHKLIDQFYFEHHVHLDELAKSWGRSMKGSIKDTLDLFYGLRKIGVPAHFWP